MNISNHHHHNKIISFGYHLIFMLKIKMKLHITLFGNPCFCYGIKDFLHLFTVINTVQIKSLEFNYMK